MKSLLYIDDSRDDRAAAVKVFKDSDITLHCVTDVSEGLKAIKEGCYDLVICDLIMPITDGLSFAKAVAKEHPTMPFIFTSGLPALRGFQDYNGLNSYLGFILKPVTPEKVFKILKEK